jgi:DNA (cytosine-5)-methyltransferase 1
MRGPRIKVPVAPPPKNGPRKVKIADGFAGGGGASLGIELALKILEAMGLLPLGHPMAPTYAVNHDEAALAMHGENHRETIHLPHNVWKVRMKELIGDDYFGLLWLSPDCRDHSPAKGGPITSRSVRDLAWVLVKWLKELDPWQLPWLICLENVPAFSKWSPLIPAADGKGYQRDLSRIGEIFHRFVKAVCAFGYSAGWHEEKSCTQGDPTIRNRLYLVFRRDGEEVQFPEPTHGDPKSDAVRDGLLQPWPVAADILDFEDDCPSIFMTREEGREYTKRTGKRVVRPLARKSHARLAKGVKRHVIDAGDDAYIATMNHEGDGFRGQSLDEPLRTVTRSRDAHGLVVPHVAIFRGNSVGRPVTEPAPTATANSFIKRPGGASPVGLVQTAMAPFVAQQNGDLKQDGSEFYRAGRSVMEPLGGLTTSPQQTVAAAALAPFVSRGQHGGGNRPATEPIHTIAASDGDQNQVVVPYLVPRYGEREGQEPRSLPIDRPMPTPVPDGNGGSLAAVYLAQHNGGARGPIGRPVDKPIATIMHEGSQQQVVTAHLTQFYGTNAGNGGDLRVPAPPPTAGGNHTGVVTVPLVTAYYSSGGQDAPVDNPMLAVPTKARFGLTHVDLSHPPLTEAQWRRARQVAEFLREFGCWDGGEIVTVTIRGVVYIIVDIGMRMLKPRELARAQGFPEWYVLDPIFRGKPLSETEQRATRSAIRLPARRPRLIMNGQPFLFGEDWNEVLDGNATARDLFRRHYSYRRRVGGRVNELIVGPGFKLLLLTRDAGALCVWRKEKHRADGQLGVECAIYRRESGDLASVMLGKAMDVAWSRFPGERLFTFVDPRKVQPTMVRGKPVWGFCFYKAGWSYSGLTKGGLHILDVVPA